MRNLQRTRLLKSDSTETVPAPALLRKKIEEKDVPLIETVTSTATNYSSEVEVCRVSMRRFGRFLRMYSDTPPSKSVRMEATLYVTYLLMMQPFGSVPFLSARTRTGCECS